MRPSETKTDHGRSETPMRRRRRSSSIPLLPLLRIFKIYLIEISPRPTDPESKKTKTATVKTTKPTHIVGNYKAGCVVKPFPHTDCPMLKVIEAPACDFCQKEVGKATLMPCGCTITCLNCAYKVLHNSRVCPVCTNPVSIWQPKEDPAE